MAKKVYVGNLSYDTTDSVLQTMFEEFGTVQSAQVVVDGESGRSKGFGFVEMTSDQAETICTRSVALPKPRCWEERLLSRAF